MRIMIDDEDDGEMRRYDHNVREPTTSVGHRPYRRTRAASAARDTDADDAAAVAVSAVVAASEARSGQL